jgi:oligopeptide transport system substrate-binding protein
MKKIVFFLFLIPFLIGCHKKGKTLSEGRIVNFSFLSPIRSLDPRISNEYPSCHVVKMLYEGLMHIDLEGNPTFGIAESVDISEDQLTYTFHLRDSKWTNGDPVTAYDFEYAWKKAVDPRYAQTGAFTFYTIKNVSACLEKKVSVDDVGIHALDAKTLQVELEHPAPYFLSLTSCATYSPINKKIDQEHPNWCNDVGEFFVTNGPFKVDQWKKSVEITLKKNDFYWDADAVKLSGIRIQIIPDANTQFCLFEKGELDWVGQPFNSLPFDIIKDKNVFDKIEKKEMVGLNWLFLNTNSRPLSNKNIRKAIAYAINRKEITDHVYQMGETPALKILNSELTLQEEPYFDDGNVNKAREYLEIGLKELGMTKKELGPIVISQRSSIFYLRVTQAIQQQIHEALGLQVEIEQSDFPVHFNKLAKGDFCIGEMGWISWLRDPIYMLDTFRNRSFATNMSKWEDSRYQALLEKSDHEIDPIKRKEYLHKAEELLMEEMPVIPICFITLTFMKNPDLHDVYVSPLKELDLRYAYFAKNEVE